MPNLYEHIGAKIRELRTKYPKGTLSQEALSSHLKVAPNTVSRWETGTYKPTPEAEAARDDRRARMIQRVLRPVERELDETAPKNKSKEGLSTD